MFYDLSPALLHTLYLVAIVAEAMTAALSAGRRDMDWMGVCIIACVTALGGGSLRDVLLGHYPLTWVVHPEYLWMTAGAALLTALIAPVMRRLRSVFLLADALGLVAFTVIGCQVAQLMQLPITVVLISGMITGCAGGVLRDVLCNEVPLLFRKAVRQRVGGDRGAVPGRAGPGPAGQRCRAHRAGGRLGAAPAGPALQLADAEVRVPRRLALRFALDLIPATIFLFVFQ